MARISRTLGFLCFLSASIPCTLAQELNTPVAACAQLQRDIPCLIKWDFVTSPRDQYRTQMWDSTQAQWIDMASKPEIHAAFVSTESAVPGKLYRVLACNSGGMQCVSSTAVWSPAWLAVADIPEFIPINRSKAELLVDPNFPKTYQVAKDKSRSAQLAQYNLYLLVNELASVDSPEIAASLPPMQLPNYIMTSSIPQTLEEVVIYNVYSTYESIRQER